jgi:hypothetical protein
LIGGKNADSFLDLEATAAKKPLKTPDDISTRSPSKKRKKGGHDPMYDSVDRRDSRHSIVTGPRSKNPDNRRLDRHAMEGLKHKIIDDERNTLQPI